MGNIKGWFSALKMCDLEGGGRHGVICGMMRYIEVTAQLVEFGMYGDQKDRDELSISRFELCERKTWTDEWLVVLYGKSMVLRLSHRRHDDWPAYIYVPSRYRNSQKCQSP